MPATTLKGDDFLLLVILFYDLCRTVVFTVWSLVGSSRPFLRAHEVETDFTTAPRCNSPLSLRCHLTDGVGAMVGQTAGFSVFIEATAPKGTRGPCVLHHQAISLKKIPVPFRDVFDKAVKLIPLNLIPLSTYLFNILWNGN